ncbi:hypothetical protein TIFTF001_036113 [Ficus carica]|uniref:Uncharacterized protein n=1 Tax=Ficus carica TaxID=3494 RepID=A0AA88E3P5_FICCA|nr:hypothetical protein TIFTF001_036113 [Ficus carica]
MPLDFAQVDDRTAVERLTSEADVLVKSHKDLRASSVALEWWRRMDHNREQFSMATGSRPRSNLDDRIVTSTATVPFGFCFLFLSPTPARFDIRPSCDDGGSFRRRYSRGGNRWSARFRYFGLGFWLFWD